MNDHLVIAVDGPSGSGKSSTARGVATRLGLHYLDTGAMYRAITWQVLRRGVDPDDASAVGSVTAATTLTPATDPSASSIGVDGVDVGADIRTTAVTAAVSAVSAVPDVRRQMVALQRAIIGDGGIVVEGRDIAGVVWPQAQVKVYLTADVDARARRRSAEQGLRGARHVTATRDDLDRRDTLDSTRSTSPLTLADGATVLDTTDLTLEQVIDAVVVMARQAVAR
ncbi:MAG: (d)CMP kinase [Nocardioidaceae bacterium]